MKIACKYCGIVSKPHDCPRKPKRKNKSRYRKDVSVYNTKAYRRERENILDTYNKACLWSVYVIGETKVADEVHHIIEVLEDESKGTEPSNLIPLTSSAHDFIHDLYDCNADVKEAEKIMSEKQVRRIPVMQNDKIIGMLTIGDLASNDNVNDNEVCNTIGCICGSNKNNAE